MKRSKGEKYMTQIPQIQTQSKIKDFFELKNELGIKYKRITKALVEVIKKLDGKLPCADLEDEEEVVKDTWIDGSIVRSSWYTWATDDGELLLRYDVQYSGLEPWYLDPIEEIQKLAQKKKYNVIRKLAERLPIFLKTCLENARKQGKQLDQTLEKLEKILKAL